MKTRKREMAQLPELEELRKELRRVRSRNRYIKLLRSTIGILSVSAAAAVLAVTLWFPVLQILGSSMAPTLEQGDIIICFRGGEPVPGKLVSFTLGNKLLVKRCIAGPGQQVDLDDQGTVFVDGIALEESYLSAAARGEGDVEMPFRVPEGQYFCLGDKRETSVDSRYEAVGCISRDAIEGFPLLRVWPLNRFGLLE